MAFQQPFIIERACAEEITIWRVEQTTLTHRFIWAPELHYIAGKWYIYYAGSCCTDNYWDFDCNVLECEGSDPYTDKWVEKGKFQKTEKDTFSFTGFSLDMTYFEAKGRSYVIWAQQSEHFKISTRMQRATTCLCTMPAVRSALRADAPTPEMTRCLIPAATPESARLYGTGKMQNFRFRLYELHCCMILNCATQPFKMACCKILLTTMQPPFNGCKFHKPAKRICQGMSFLARVKFL